MNLIYHRIVRHLSAEERQKIDDELTSYERPRVVMGGRAVKVPSWWKGDAGAAQSSIAAARSLGFQVAEVAG